MNISKTSGPANIGPGRLDQLDGVQFFGRGNTGDNLLFGWAAPEENQNWNDGTEVGYQLRVLPPPRTACIIRIEGAPFINAQLRRQTITMYVNGLRLGWWSLSDPQRVWLEVRIEPEQWLIREDVAIGDIRWHIPQSISPHELGISADERRLGFCFVSIVVSST